MSVARTQGQLLDELTKRVDALALALEGLRTSSTVEMSYIKEGVRELQVLSREIQASESKLAERVAALEQRCAAMEKLSDRGWQVRLAAVAFGFSVISLLLTAALQLKK